MVEIADVQRYYCRAAKRFPMMAEHQLIVVREAQFLKGIDGILDYLENPVQVDGSCVSL